MKNIRDERKYKFQCEYRQARFEFSTTGRITGNGAGSLALTWRVWGEQMVCMDHLHRPRMDDRIPF